MHSAQYLGEIAALAKLIDASLIEIIVQELVNLRARHGRLFLIGLGGSAANCSHAVNDFRKLCGIEAYTPVDNIAELTARANDEGWKTIFANWLSYASGNDDLMVLSVGGGKGDVSRPIVHAIDEALTREMKILGIVGRDGGHTALYGDYIIVIPTIEESRVTPHVESFQSVILHCLVSHPDLQIKPTKW